MKNRLIVDWLVDWSNDSWIIEWLDPLKKSSGIFRDIITSTETLTSMKVSKYFYLFLPFLLYYV